MAKVLRYKDNILRMSIPKHGDHSKMYSLSRFMIDTNIEPGEEGRPLTFIDGEKTLGLIQREVGNRIQGSHRSLIGKYRSASYDALEAAIKAFNSNGTAIQLEYIDGHTGPYTPANAEVGSVIEIQVTNGNFEEMIVGVGKQLILFTQNNKLQKAIDNADKIGEQLSHKIDTNIQNINSNSGKISTNTTEINKRLLKTEFVTEKAALLQKINSNSNEITTLKPLVQN